MTDRRLVLVGGGHAHLHVLRELARRPVSNAEVVLVSSEAHHHYSGMVPGFLQGTYDLDALRIDLAALARSAGARFVHATADRVGAADRVVAAAGEEIAFDLCSLDVGGAAAGSEIPGVAAHAFVLRPMARAVELRGRVDALLAGSSRPRSILVVGGGAGGVEIAFALDRRMRDRRGSGAVTIVDAGRELLAEYGLAARTLAARLVRRRGIGTVLGGRVTAVHAGGVTLASGAVLPADLVVWIGGAAPPALLGSSDLPRSAEGFFLVDRTLRSLDGAPVWGAGDCVTLGAAPATPKAGVYAVREAPVLERNLRRALAGRRAAARYRPQRSYLALLNTADGRALLRWGVVSVHARWAWRLKDAIDRRFVRRYRQIGGVTK